MSMGDRKALVAANWKMYKTIAEARRFVEELQAQVGPCVDREVVIAPPFTALPAIARTLRTNGFALAAQNCHWEEQGAFTGEVSVGMLRDVGCLYVIVGHSERRNLFGETDSMIQKKVDAVYRHGLTPILCIGETLQQREAAETFEVVVRQFEEAVVGVNQDQARQLVLAYEPVWAIGTGRTATPEQAQEVHHFLRERIATRFDKTIANHIRMVYGGSVKTDNVDALMAQPDIDGLLVGGASLEVTSFIRIVQFH
ncbi:MAG TPA: triose-phosphate isomerase [Syntrophobacteraceae bacterium]|nr:triose-phosphate isomerase [Syntrophobacteraceae bacterium]